MDKYPRPPWYMLHPQPVTNQEVKKVKQVKNDDENAGERCDDKKQTAPNNNPNPARNEQMPRGAEKAFKKQRTELCLPNECSNK